MWSIRSLATGGGGLERNTEFILEEVGLNDKGDGRQGEVHAVGDGESENLGEIPTVRSH